MGFATLIDPAGDVLVTGSFSGTIRFDTVSLAHSLGSAGFNDVYVAKYSARGELRWAVRAGGTDDDSGLALALDPQGNIYVAGDFNSPEMAFGDTVLRPVGSYDVFVAKLSPAGEWVWARRAGGPGHDGVGGLAVDGRGSIYLAGQFQDSAAFGRNRLRSHGDDDAFVARLDRYGRWQWARGLGGAYKEVAADVAADARGHVWLTGAFAGPTLTVGATTLTNKGQPTTDDLYVAALTHTGEWQWAVRAGGEQNETGCAVAADSAGNAYVAGLFTSPAVDFGSIRRANTRDPFLDPTHTADAFVAKLSGAGKWLWATQAQGDRDERPADLCADSAGTVRLTGTFESPTLGLGGTTLRREAKRRGATAGANASRSAWFAAELSAAGAWQWAVGGPGGTGGLSVGRGGEVALTGFFPDSVVTLGPVTLNGPDEDGGLFIGRLTREAPMGTGKRRREKSMAAKP